MVPPLAVQRRRRRPGYVALLVVLVVGLAAVGGWLYSTAGQKFSVVVVVAQVQAGEVIARSDLSTVEVAGEVTALAAANLGQAVGQRAAVTLLPGVLLQRQMFSAGPILAPGQAQVGVVLKGGQLPANGVYPGDVVQVLRLPAPGSGNVSVQQPQAAGEVGGGSGEVGTMGRPTTSASTQPSTAQPGSTPAQQSSAAQSSAMVGVAPTILTSGTVITAKADPAQTGGWLVTVSVPQAAAAAVAGASGAELAALIQVAS